MNSNKMDNSITEGLAVGVIENAIYKSGMAKPRISKNDKTISIDGFIEIYNSTPFTKASLCDVIPVQVKGTKKKCKSEIPKHKFNIADLNNYLNIHNGILYFVVYINPKTQTSKIFYQSLCPYDIQKILNELSNSAQSTKTLKLLPFPEDSFLITKLLREFQKNRHDQLKANVLVKLDDDIKFDEVKFGSIYAEDTDLASLKSWAFGTYLYGHTDKGMWYVFDKIPAVASKDEGLYSIAAGQEAIIQSGQDKFTTTLFHGEDKEGQFIRFGGITIYFGDDSKINYKPTGSFHERYRDTQFLLNAVELNSFYINDIHINGCIKFSDKQRSRLINEVAFYKRYSKLFDILRIKLSWSPDDLSEDDFNKLGILGRYFIDGKAVDLKSFSDELINLNFNIANGRIKIIAHRRPDGLYDLFNTLEPKMSYGIARNMDTEQVLPIPAGFLLNTDDFEMVCNLDSNLFREALKAQPIQQGTSDIANNKLLEMISAYDHGSICENDLYECIELLADELVRINPESETSLINRFQVTKRTRSLTGREKASLRSMAMDSGDLYVQACAWILLDQSEAAQAVLAKLSGQQRSAFYKWPIAKFLPTFK